MKFYEIAMDDVRLRIWKKVTTKEAKESIHITVYNSYNQIIDSRNLTIKSIEKGYTALKYLAEYVSLDKEDYKEIKLAILNEVQVNMEYTEEVYNGHSTMKIFVDIMQILKNDRIKYTVIDKDYVLMTLFDFRELVRRHANTWGDKPLSIEGRLEASGYLHKKTSKDLGFHELSKMYAVLNKGFPGK